MGGMLANCVLTWPAAYPGSVPVTSILYPEPTGGAGKVNVARPSEFVTAFRGMASHERINWMEAPGTVEPEGSDDTTVTVISKPANCGSFTAGLNSSPNMA